MANQTFYRVPLTLDTFKCYRSWLRDAIDANTLFVVSDLKIQEKFAALVVLNFVRINPDAISIVVVNQNALIEGYQKQCEACGLQEREIHVIHDEKSFVKCVADSCRGVYFMSSKILTNLLGRDRLNSVDVSLLVVLDSLKASSNTGHGRLVTQLNAAGKTFRVLGLCFNLATKLSKNQSMISNLAIQNVMSKSSGDPELSEILFSKDSVFEEVGFAHPILPRFRMAVLTRMSHLRSLKLINEYDPDALLYSDIEEWRQFARRVSREQTVTINAAAVLLEAYRTMLFYGPRAVFLFFAVKFKKHPAIAQMLDSPDLEDLKDLMNVYSFEAFPGRKKRHLLDCHPKFLAALEVIEIVSAKVDRQAVVFCSSPYGARAFAEYLDAFGVKFMEYNPEYYFSIDGVKQKDLIGPKEHAADMFMFNFARSKTPVLVQANDMSLLGKRGFDMTICLDYLVSGYKYTGYGKKSNCYLTAEYEKIPKQLRTFDKKRDNSKPLVSFNYRKEVSKLALSFPLCKLPIEFRPKSVRVSASRLKQVETKEDDLLTKKERKELYRKFDKSAPAVISTVAEEMEYILTSSIHERYQHGSFIDYHSTNSNKSTQYEKELFKVLSRDVDEAANSSRKRVNGSSLNGDKRRRLD